jgi:hypothetical protein
MHTMSDKEEIGNLHKEMHLNISISILMVMTKGMDSKAG